MGRPMRIPLLHRLVRSLRSVPVLAVAALLASCHTLAQLRVHRTVRSPDSTAVLGIWIRAPGPVLSDPPKWLADAFVAVLFYPLDVLSSTVVAVGAPFDPDLDIAWGPAGALAGIALPGLTLMPYLYPAFHMMFPPPDLPLEPASFDALLARIQAGDGLGAYCDIVGSCPWDGGADAMLAVEVIDDRPAATDPSPR